MRCRLGGIGRRKRRPSWTNDDDGGSDCSGDRGMLIRGRAHRSGDTGGAVLSSCGDRTSPLDGTTRRSNVLDKKRRQREVSAAKAMTTSDGDGTIAMVNLLVNDITRDRVDDLSLPKNTI